MSTIKEIIFRSIFNGKKFLNNFIFQNNFDLTNSFDFYVNKVSFIKTLCSQACRKIDWIGFDRVVKGSLYGAFLSFLSYGDLYDDIIRFLSLDISGSYDPLRGKYRDHIIHTFNVMTLMLLILNSRIISSSKIINLIKVNCVRELVRERLLKEERCKCECGNENECENINHVVSNLIGIIDKISEKLSSINNFKNTNEYKEIEDWSEKTFGNLWRRFEFESHLESDWEGFRDFIVVSSGLLHDIGYGFRGDPLSPVSLLKLANAFDHSLPAYLFGEENGGRDIARAALNTIGESIISTHALGKGVYAIVHPVASAYIILRRTVKGSRLWFLRNVVATVILRHSWHRGDFSKIADYKKSIRKHSSEVLDHLRREVYRRQISIDIIEYYCENYCKENEENVLVEIAENYPFSLLLYIADELERTCHELGYPDTTQISE